jgi:hypothetical protein
MTPQPPLMIVILNENFVLNENIEGAEFYKNYTSVQKQHSDCLHKTRVWLHLITLL